MPALLVQIPQVNIIDISDPANPNIFKPSDATKHKDSEVTAVAWNRKVEQILCSTSNSGLTVVWDLKKKKEARARTLRLRPLVCAKNKKDMKF